MKKSKAGPLRKIFKSRRKEFDQRRVELRSDLLMSGVAHEFNNILGAADGHAEWALDSKNPEDMIEALKVVRIACQRSATITRALRGVSQPREEQEEEFLFSELVDEFRLVMAPLIQKTATKLEIKVPAKVRIRGIRNEVLEVLLNLVKNSIESVSNTDQSPEILIEGALQKGTMSLKFFDNGPGVPAALEDLIFQPFFTTKGVLGNLVLEGRAENLSSGSGLGLFWSRKICQEMGGSLEFKAESKSSKSHFELRLKVL